MKELMSEADLDACLEEAEREPVFILKHSTKCSISTGAYKRVKAYEEETGGKPPVYVVNVVEAKPVSNAISERLGVEHRSPQMILLHRGEVLWMGSHHGIHADKLNKAVDLASS
ncbi:MAG: bacillithiol system redox-active protein YtxJ [Candidatus Hydrogenedentota bacterium]